MKHFPRASRSRRLLFAALVLCAVALPSRYLYVHGQAKADFPDGYDAVQAAPDTHRVVFENEFVRVLEVTVPAAGKIIPMHHHRWPGFFLDWDTGGGSPYIRYRQPNGTVRDIPAHEEPRHPGVWHVQWMKPEPMHSIEVVSKSESATQLSQDPTELRIEIKCHP
ncbi:MAG: hypothetical protein WA510_03430 [Acidobacteriaceae bacterium]|jgi:hypothetical protein